MDRAQAIELKHWHRNKKGEEFAKIEEKMDRAQAIKEIVRLADGGHAAWGQCQDRDEADEYTAGKRIFDVSGFRWM